MHSNPRKRDRLIAELNNRDRANQLITWLNNRLVQRGVMLDTDSQQAIHNWMSFSFHRGIERGKHVQKTFGGGR